MFRADVLLATSLLLGCSAPTHPTVEQEPRAAAEAAARSWLEVVDAGDYEKSWDAASELFRQNMARFGKDASFWVKSLNVSRAPLGDVRMREVARVEPDAGIAGMPPGDFVEVEYLGTFVNQDRVTETIVMTLESDAEWRMANYIIDRE